MTTPINVQQQLIEKAKADAIAHTTEFPNTRITNRQLVQTWKRAANELGILKATDNKTLLDQYTTTITREVERTLVHVYPIETQICFHLVSTGNWVLKNRNEVTESLANLCVDSGVTLTITDTIRTIIGTI